MPIYKNNSTWLALTGITLALASELAFADISGIVFRDYNSNGIKDNTGSYNESGVGGINITCTDSGGGTATTTSSTDPAILGTYTLTGCTGQT